jgi:DNA-binding NtrC family response regulator
MPKRIVVVDDDPTMRAALHETLSAAGYETVQCIGGEEAELVLRGGGIDLVISDVRMPGMDGLELLRRAQAINPVPPFIVISGNATVSEAVEAMKMGAYDFLVKPFSYRELIALVEAALAREVKEDDDTATLREEDAGAIVTAHPKMLALLKFATEVAKSQASVLVQGESGTGKELLARFIHARSRRKHGPFVAVNCAALPEGLLESELFGHERGAFTGAIVSKPGKFELAHNGTLLLDEASEMPLVLQAKLLRVLQEREVDRVGGRKPLRVDIRVIATTNRDLRRMVSAGTFREDLFYRLNVIPLRLLPLRERSEDIEAIARALLQRNGYRKATLTPQALTTLQAHPWPGNIRELGNVLERAAIMAADSPIKPEHLLLEDEPFSVECGVRSLESPVTSHASRVASHEISSPSLQTGDARYSTPDARRPTENEIHAGVSVQEMEERLIRKTLVEVQDNRTRAAKLLGISVRTLRNKLKQYQLVAAN